MDCSYQSLLAESSNCCEQRELTLNDFPESVVCAATADAAERSSSRCDCDDCDCESCRCRNCCHRHHCHKRCCCDDD
ncbi:MAG: hypothetical protein II306_06880 [Clostridia bacterium]|nr:hypothetical protein [Clostridia bacterium]MEE1025051.1 hypothetical protein [Acutalibacteraceae bacterium]